MGQKFQRVFIILLLIMILLTGLIAAASAAETITAKDWTNNLDLSYTVDEIHNTGSDLTIPENTINKVYKIETTNSAANSDKTKIIVGNNSDVVLVFNGVNLTTDIVSDLAGRSPIQLGNNSSVTIVLIDGTKNIISCNGNSITIGVPQAGIYVRLNSNLTIRGQEDNSGELEVNAGRYGAGIGGGVNGHYGNIVIEGGIVKASTRVHNNTAGTENGAGIGSGGGNTQGTSEPNAGGYSSSITICGHANVTATSQGNGAGIGGGSSNSNITQVSISGTGGIIHI